MEDYKVINPSFYRACFGRVKFAISLFVLTLLLSYKAVADTLSFGMFPAIPPVRLENQFGPLVKAIDGMLSDKVVFRSKMTTEDYKLALINGEYDIAVVQPFVFVEIESFTPYKPLLRRVETSEGVIVVKRDSELTELMELKNRTIAIPSEDAVAVVLARYMFQNIGLNKDQYSFVNLNNHDSCLQAVAVNEVIACITMKRLSDRIAGSRGFEFKALATSVEIPGMLIVTHPRIDHLRDELLEKLVEFSVTPQGREALLRASLDSLVEVEPNDYDEVKKILNELRD
ncbi:phosphate/phosphite/phosphonate ABC transporter substrate-binding protein [Aurantivibrio infirmus]